MLGKYNINTVGRFVWFTLCIFCTIGFSCRGNNTTQIDSTINSALQNLQDQIFQARLTQGNIGRYKVYSTQNIYISLFLDTATGKINLLQWSLDSDKEGIWTLNNEDLSITNFGAGTFELYPTQNMYQFILIDTVMGRAWHVQWGIEEANCWIRRIFDTTLVKNSDN